MSRYYDDDDDDDDPYAPRIGPAAMPSPRSKFAPYYSGCTDSFEDFLEEYEGLAYDCALTDPQRVDVIIRYVAPSLRDFWRSLSGYHSCDWPQLRQSLVNIFGNPTPRHQIMRQKLHSHVQDSSRRRMDCEDDVLQYYRQFLCYSAPLVHTGHLSEEERDAAFWYGFHPEDRQVLQPRLLSKNPLQPPDVPFHFEDVFGCARAAFAYNSYFPSPWSQELKFGPPESSRREQRVAEHGSRDAYSFRAVTCAIASNAETTPDELPLSSHSTPYTQLPSSSSLSASESQQTQAPSVTLDQPEPAYTLSTTLLPSAYFPTPSHTSSLAHSAADEVPEILSTFPSPSITPVPFSMPMSDFEYLPSATVDQPAPTLSSTPPSASSISSMFLPSPARLATEDLPEPESASTPPIRPSSPILLSGPSLPSPSTDDVPEIASTPPSSSSVSLTNLECVPSEMVDKPEFEPEHASLSSVTPTSPPLPAPSLPLEFTDDIREFLSPLPTPLSTSLACSEYSTSLSSPTNPSPSETPTSMPSDPHSIPAHSSWPLRSSSGDSSDTVVELVVVPVSLNPSSLSLSLGETIPPPDCSLASHPSPLSIEVSPLLEISTPDPLRPFELDSTPSPAVDIIPLSQPEPSWSSPCEFVLLLASLEPIQCPPTLPQRPPGLKTVSSVSSTLDVTPSFALLIPRLGCRDSPLVYEAPSTRLPTLAPPSLLSLRLSGASIRFNFAFVFITTAVLVSAFLNVSATTFTLARKFWSKYEDLGNNQNGNLKTSNSRNIPTHRLRLGQLTPRAPRLVFDPGGPASSSSFKLLSAHEDVRKRKSKTCSGFTILDTSLPIPIPTDNLIVFDPGSVGGQGGAKWRDSPSVQALLEAAAAYCRRVGLHSLGYLVQDSVSHPVL
ncbi:hypothetical protein EDB85DRAFT_2289843 [Lactarius pseudohatsudake]|nr:hypothetical protein EDB85DRAFT_2289843 [Lactarius pseudohatsudake]